jgi:hypothetical protein
MRLKVLSLIMIALIGSGWSDGQEKKPAKPAPNSEVKLVPLRDQLPNTWVKRSPLKDAPLSPMLGYEGSFGYDPKANLVIRWAGHNQGGGGEQNAETWTFDPLTARWTLKEPNTSPPGACCAQQNVFDPVGGRFLRFTAFSGNHGWHWFRENYLNNSSVWTYDLVKNTWRDMRPVPTPRIAPLRCASWDSDHQVAVLFGGEGSLEGTLVYDPYTNEWTRKFPKTEPKGRSAGNMAYHKAMKKHFLFGSQFSDDPHTWAYDLAKNEWTDLKPATSPPTDQNDAVLAYDEVNNVIVASIRAPGGKNGDDRWHFETWVYHAVGNTWKKMNPTIEPPGGGQRRRIMVAISDQNVVLMENYVNPPQKIPGVEREQQIWTYRYDTPKGKPRLRPPSVRLETTPKGVILRWEGDTFGGWRVYQDSAKFEKITYLDKEAREFEEDLDRFEQSDWFYVEAGDEKGTRYFSVKERAKPRLVEDVIASVLSPTKVTLAWPAAKEPDVVGYHVERAQVEVFSEDQLVRLRTDTQPLDEPSVGAIKAIGKFERVTQETLKQPTFTDTGIDLTKPREVKDDIYRHRFAASQINAEGKVYRYAVYAYRVRAVNKLGVASGPGPYALTIPSGPQWVFSKEAAAKCHLKWEKNPEQGIKGYRVYRMESPRINGPGQPVTRLTTEPVGENHYLDEKAGKVTRRYWVVAVDALGQEGFPSAPVWFERQYKKYYLPFTGEWHQ